MLRIVLGGAAALVLAVPAAAATSLVNADGKLIGASGVVVEGKAYDVAFVDATCSSAFGSCDADAFAFKTEASARAAAAALASQVFVDGALGDFDTVPGLTFGCATPNSTGGACSALIPYETFIDTGALWWRGATVRNLVGAGSGPVGIGTFFADYDYAGNNNGVWAKFTATSVPEPASWALMLLGFGLLGGAMRRRQDVAVTYS